MAQEGDSHDEVYDDEGWFGSDLDEAFLSASMGGESERPAGSHSSSAGGVDRKRRRVRGKQTPAASFGAPERVSEDPETQETIARPHGAVDSSTWPAWRWRDAARKYAVGKGAFALLVAPGRPSGDGASCGALVPKYGDRVAAVRSMTLTDQQAYYERVAVLARREGRPSQLCDALESLAGIARPEEESQDEGEARVGAGPRHRVLSVLLTFNGSWGLLPSELQLRASSREDQDRCLAALRQSEFIVALFGRLAENSQQLAARHSMAHWSLSLEACQADPVTSSVVRVHAHMFCVFRGQSKLSFRAMAFDGSPAHYSSATTSSSGQSRGRHVLAGLAQGHYYCLAPKTSSILCVSSDLPSHAAIVKPVWVLNLFAERKMWADVAEAEIVRSRRDVARSIALVRAVRAAERQQQLADLMVTVSRAEQSLRRPRREVPEVLDTFLGQFRRPMLRRRFLVLDGPSGRGKTEYVKSLAADPAIRAEIKQMAAFQTSGAASAQPLSAGGAELLEVSCHGDNDELPDLRELDIFEHGWLLLDEATPYMVLKYKRLFQGKSGMANCGSSATNVHAFQLCTWGLRIVLTANDWSLRCASLSVPDQEWLRDNTVAVEVLEPLWTFRGNGGEAFSSEAGREGGFGMLCPWNMCECSSRRASAQQPGRFEPTEHHVAMSVPASRRACV